MTTYAAAVAEFIHNAPASGNWSGLSFFRTSQAEKLLSRIDARVSDGAHVLPSPQDFLTALRLTSLNQLRVVILGQDPYPTPGDAHGLAFSYAGQGRLPASLKNIFKELADDLGGSLRADGNLSDWAEQGVLLLNTALTVEAGQAGAHLSWGWQVLADEVMRAAGAKKEPCVFMLWGDKARSHRPAIGSQHRVLESPHPSPLSAYRGFFGSRPFSQANEFLAAQGRGEIAWLPFTNGSSRPT